MRLLTLILAMFLFVSAAFSQDRGHAPRGTTGYSKDTKYHDKDHDRAVSNGYRDDGNRAPINGIIWLCAGGVVIAMWNLAKNSKPKIA